MTIDARKITLKLPTLYDKQREAIFNDARYSVIEASTKTGKTAGCIVWILAEAWGKGRRGRNYWWIAPVYPQASIAYRRLVRMLDQAAPRAAIGWKKNESDLWVELPNGARIWFKSAEKPDNLFGEDVFAAVIDEATRMREEAWHAIRSTLTATRGRVRIIGNVKGRRNWAYKLGQRAKRGDDRMHYAKLTAYDAVAGGILDADEVEDAKRQLPAAVFRELYLAEPSDDGGNPFGMRAIERCTREGLSDGPAVVYGVDLAKSVDYTVAIGTNESGGVCEFHRWQADWGTTLRRLVDVIGDTPALVDSTGVGDPIVEDLQRECSRVQGFKFTAPSKQKIMEGLAVDIQQESIEFPEGEIADELHVFEYEYTRTGVRYTAPEGLHDDCVCALALASEGRRTLPLGELGFSLVEFGGKIDEGGNERQWRSVDRDFGVMRR